MTIPSFRQYLVEEVKEVFFTFGRMNPPTIGHGKLMNVMSAKAGKNPYKIYLSHSNDARKNPLTYDQKVKYVRKMFPKHSRNVIKDKKVRNVFEAASSLYDQGFVRINMIVGADRIQEFKQLLEKYNGVKGRHGFYNFEKINVISAGDRDPDAEGVEGMSASKQRANAQNNDFTTFSQGVPRTMSNADAKKLFNDLRKGMGLKESTDFRNRVSLEPVSDLREKYIDGELFVEGDRVVIKNTRKEGYVHRLGANYVIIALDEGRISRQWIDNVELSEKYLPDEGTDEAAAHAKKMTPHQEDNDPCWKSHRQVGMKKKNGKEVPNCVPREELKLTLSRAKKALKVNEDVTPKQINDLEKFADRLLNKFDIDVEFTRHFADRMNDKRNKPAIKIAELQKLFKKIARSKGAKIRQVKDAEVVLKDLQNDLNLPIVIKYDKVKDEFEVVNKTIMRKRDFKTSNKVIQYEAKTVKEDEVSQVRRQIDQEQERDKKKYDRMLDRARIRRAIRKSKQTQPGDNRV